MLFLENLITDWRGQWGRTFPFAWVQLPEFREAQSSPGEGGRWPILREKMLKSASCAPKPAWQLPWDWAGKRHSPEEQKGWGKRISLWALSEVYGRKMPWAGPLPESHTIQGNEICGEIFPCGRRDWLAQRQGSH